MNWQNNTRIQHKFNNKGNNIFKMMIKILSETQNKCTSKLLISKARD